MSSQTGDILFNYGPGHLQVSDKKSVKAKEWPFGCLFVILVAGATVLFVFVLDTGNAS